jgi:uncharacterized peroxidase-related enzyme
MRKDDVRIQAITEEDPDTPTSMIFEQARRQYGWLPNTIRVMARGSSAAELYMTAGSLNRGGSLSAVERELLAILVAARNDCDYCLLAHSILARRLGSSAAEVLEAHDARSPEPRTTAILRFASALLQRMGALTDHELDRARAAGLTDTTLIDILGVVIENCLGNFINNLAQTEPDDVLRTAARKMAVTDGAVAPTAVVGASR